MTQRGRHHLAGTQCGIGCIGGIDCKGASLGDTCGGDSQSNHFPESDACCRLVCGLGSIESGCTFDQRFAGFPPLRSTLIVLEEQSRSCLTCDGTRQFGLDCRRLDCRKCNHRQPTLISGGQQHRSLLSPIISLSPPTGWCHIIWICV